METACWTIRQECDGQQILHYGTVSPSHTRTASISMKNLLLFLLLLAARFCLAADEAAKSLYELAPNPAEVAAGKAAGLESGYGPDAQAEDGVLRLNHRGAIIRVTDPRFMAVDAVDGRVVEFSADLRVGAPAGPEDSSFVLAMAFGGQVIDGAVWLAPRSLSANKQHITLPFKDWFRLQVQFDAAHRLYAVFVNGRLVLRAPTTATDTPPTLWFGDGSSSCSGTCRSQSLSGSRHASSFHSCCCSS